MIIWLFLSTFSLAGIFELTQPCSTHVAYQEKFESKQNVGTLSVEIFEREKIPYMGSELGFHSILKTPVDKDAIEWLGPNELRAYGWCFSLNGEIPETMPNETSLRDGDTVKWFYAFSHYKEGKFISQCEPSAKVSEEKFCQAFKNAN